MVKSDFFRALGDPYRLEIVKRLSSGESHTITSLTDSFPISRQGARKHLQILADAKVIMLKPVGRDTAVVLNVKELEKGKAFISKLEAQWDKRLQALKDFVEE